MTRDNEKRELCKELNIKLIEVPYWWDGTEGALTETVKEKVKIEY
jgi:hypothetical protein